MYYNTYCKQQKKTNKSKEETTMVAKKTAFIKNAREELEVVGTRYARNKTQEAQLNKANKVDNERIKDLFELMEITEFEVNGFVLNKSVATTRGYKEDELIKFIENNLNEEDIHKVVKTKAYVDMDALQEILDEGLICKTDIEPYETEKQTVKLLVKEKKV